MHDDKYSYYLPYYVDIMEPAIELLEEQDVPISTYLRVDYPGLGELLLFTRD